MPSDFSDLSEMTGEYIVSSVVCNGVSEIVPMVHSKCTTEGTTKRGLYVVSPGSSFETRSSTGNQY